MNGRTPNDSVMSGCEQDGMVRNKVTVTGCSGSLFRPTNSTIPSRHTTLRESDLTPYSTQPRGRFRRFDRPCHRPCAYLPTGRCGHTHRAPPAQEGRLRANVAEHGERQERQPQPHSAGNAVRRPWRQGRRAKVITAVLCLRVLHNHACDEFR